VWLLAAWCACSTTAAQIDGPSAGLGLEIDTEGNISPRVRLGYHTAFWFDLLGYSAGLGVAYAPLASRVETYLEAGAYAVPLFGLPLTPISLGFGAAHSPDRGWEVLLQGGLEVFMFMPPEACWPPLEGDWGGCPAGAFTSEDIVYPEWLPRVEFRGAVHFGVDSGQDRGLFYLGFDPIMAMWQLRGTHPVE
jgi:hypothetical protein